MNLISKLDEATNRSFDERQIVGARILLLRDGKIEFDRTKGYLDREAKLPLPENAIFRLASLTKPIVAATALAMVDKGVLALDTPVAELLPYFRPKLKDGREGKITIHHLLTHTAGLIYGYPSASDRPTVSAGLGNTDLTLEENFTRIAQYPLKYEPGTAWEYSVAIDVLGAAIAAAHGGLPGDAVEHYVTGPLGMVDTRFGVTDQSRLATAYGPGIPPIRMTEPYIVDLGGDDQMIFSPARILNKKAFQSGGAGMAGTAGDFVKFITALASGGAPILSPEIMAKATSNRIGGVTREAGMKFGYFGAVLEDRAAAGLPQANGSYDWGGVYGHSWLVDPKNKLALVVMTNVAIDGGGPFFLAIRDALYANL